MGGLENDEVSNSLVMKEEKYEAPFMRARLRRGLEAGSQTEPGSADPVWRRSKLRFLPGRSEAAVY